MNVSTPQQNGSCWADPVAADRCRNSSRRREPMSWVACAARRTGKWRERSIPKIAGDDFNSNARRKERLSSSRYLFKFRQRHSYDLIHVIITVGGKPSDKADALLQGSTLGIRRKADCVTPCAVTANCTYGRS